MDLSATDYIILALAGCAAGWINVLAGGGSLLTVPAMVFMGLPGPVANGTNRIAIIAQNIASISAFRRRGFADFRLSASLAVAASIGAFFGAHIGVSLDGAWFNRTLAVVMIAVMIIMATDKGKAAVDPAGAPRNVMLGHGLMVFAGIWGGFIQVGVGFLMMPILHRVMGLDLVRVNMHKVFIALVFSVVALGVFAARVPIDWFAGGALAVGNAIGGWIGANTAVSRGETIIRKALMVALTGMIIKLLFFP